MVADINVVFCQPVVGRNSQTMAIDKSCRDILCSCQCEEDRRKALTGGVDLAVYTVGTAQPLFEIVDIIVRVAYW